MNFRLSDEPRAFWPQGMLILLPVAVLAGLGLFSIAKDQKAVEEEAGQRARELARQLSLNLSQRLPETITQWRSVIRDLSVSRLKQLATTASASADNSASSSDTAIAQRTRPGHEPDEVLFQPMVVNRSGQIITPNPNLMVVPEPPEWLFQLTLHQRATWDEARMAEAVSRPAHVVAGLWQSFLDKGPPTEAQANAYFHILRHQLTNELAPPEAIEALCHFARTNTQWKSETGLPLSGLAVAAALRVTKPAGFTQSIFSALRDQVVSVPSLFTPQLLDEAAQRFRTVPDAHDSVQQLRQAWNRELAFSALAQSLQNSPARIGLASTNSIRPHCFWFEHLSVRWLALVFPYADDVSVTGHSTMTNLHATIHGVPQSIVERWFDRAARETGITLPTYFGLTIDLARQPVLVRRASNSLLPTADELLASAAGHILSPSRPSPEPNTSSQLAAAENTGLMDGGVFTVAIHLADRSLLLSQHRRRAFWFGTLIVGAAVAAGIGFAQARGAYFRQLRLAELKSNFVSSVSHELRAPIASVRLMAEGLASGRVQHEAKRHEYFQFIVQECRRLTTLIENVLDFARIEQRRKEYEFEPTHLIDLVRQTVALMQPSASEREVTIRVIEPVAVDAAEQLAQALLDGRAIQQAMINLLDNAIKHSPAGAVVTVGLDVVRTDAPKIHLSVEDNGPGIPTEEHERIFERFYRRGSELRRETAGIGIGLSIVKHITEAHGGRVLLRSAPGQGSRFTLELPMRTSTEGHES